MTPDPFRRQTRRPGPGWDEKEDEMAQVQTPVATAAGTRGRLAGRVFTGLAAAFLLMDASMKVFALQPAVEGTTALGYSAGTVVPLGIIQSICLLAFLVPGTAVLGAVLLTGYLGGAVATHVRMASPLLSHTLFPVYLGVLVWAGLWLRDDRVRALLPLRNRTRT
jgi:hypothetical protein